MNQNILCRVCASTDTELNLVYIYDHYEAEECIADILFELAGIKATADDGFPRYCCTQCHSDLTSAITVRRKCIESEILFQASPDCIFPLVDVESGDDDVSIKSSQHEELPKYHCSECAIDFYSTELLQEHYENKHANAIHGWQSFGVNEISLFDTTDDEVEETKKITPEKPVEQSHRCCGCSLVCDTVAELQQHSKTVHAPNAIAPCEDKPFQCEICYHTYTTQRGVIDHQIKMTKLDYQCMYCGIQYGSKFDLRYHEYKHEDHTMSCDICGRQFYKITNLRKHKESMHLAPELRQRHVCNVCGASVKTADYLKLHMQLHSNEDPYVCKICGARYKLRRYLSWHMALHKGEHTCDKCGLTFKVACELRDHKHRHMGSKKFNCSLCGSKFYTNRNYMKHMRVIHRQFRRNKIQTNK